MNGNFGKYLFITGIVIAVAGLILWLGANKLNWFGKLPGDIAIKREGFRFYMPITTMIIVSIVLSLLFWLFRKIR